MIVYRCDRCKKEVPRYEYRYVVVGDEMDRDFDPYLDKGYGICEDCAKELDNWINNNENK